MFKVVVLHHHLVPPPRSRAPRVLMGAARALHGLGEAGADLVLAGHLHRTFLAQAASSQGERVMRILHSGTTTSSRGREEEKGENTCNWIEIDDAEVRIESLRWAGEVDGFATVRHHGFERAAAVSREVRRQLV